MSQFNTFATSVSRRFAEMSQGELYTTEFSGDQLWALYLDSWPAGTNEIYRTASEHECSTCRNFVKNLGGVIALSEDGKVSTVWDDVLSDPSIEDEYLVVATALHDLVRRGAVTGIFRTQERQYGKAVTEETTESGKITWTHFEGKIADRHFVSASAAVSAASIVGRMNSTTGLFKRGLTEITSYALETVADLIAAGTLYRGPEFKDKVNAFLQLQREYNAFANDRQKEVFVWTKGAHPAAGIRNTAIGTLLQDLSEEKDVEQSLRAYERVTAPDNYKRPKSAITPRMVTAAMETITELGLEPSLYRRHATLADLSVRDVLFVDRDTKAHLKGGLGNLLMEHAQRTVAPTVVPDDLEEVTVDHLLEVLLPKADSMDLLVTNDQLGQFVSLTTAADPDAPTLFNWDSPFAWTYDGGVTDSMKQRVKAAGGRVENAALRISLGWHNGDDLDLHVHTPVGEHLYFGNPCLGPKPAGFYARGQGAQILDVDMNAGGRMNSVDPVENMSWLNRPADGVYKVVVHQYSRRSTSNVGFDLEVESAGRTAVFTYDKMVDGQVSALDVTVKDGVVVSISVHKHIVSSNASQTKWSIATGQFQRVHALTTSPNFWGDDTVGNKHFIFVLEGCLNPDPIRAVFNEYLKPGLHEHRKVFEVLGDKTKVEYSPNQLSGLGFSSTRRDSCVVQLQGPNLRKTVKVVF